MMIYRKFLKRLFDVTLSSCGIIVTAPLVGGVYLVSLRKIGRPVFFRQIRAGLKGRPFTMYKFRTMTDECDEEGNLLPDSERLTKYGDGLRRLSIDELPQLINILKGDMSIIGPRPLPAHYQMYYDDYQIRRQEVRPGIVGLASIRGRNNQSWESKFENDVEYVNNCSFLVDVKIFFLAFATVLKREDVSAEGYAVGEPFIKEGMRINEDFVCNNGENRRHQS